MFRIKETYFCHMSEIIKNYLSMFWYHQVNRSLNSEISCSDTEVPQVAKINDPFPLVVLIGGVGGSGKSTFIQYCKNHMEGVYEESTIDCCKEVVRFMADLEKRDHSSTGLRSEIDLKTDKYRTLLNKLKTAWCEIDDGPNELIVNKIQKMFDDNDCPSVIFVNVREPDQIDHLKSKLENEAACIVLTLVVTRNESDMFSNIADRTTLDYDYDLYVDNTSDLESLEKIAVQFCVAVHATNKVIQKLYLDTID